MAVHMKYGGSTIELVELCPGSPKAKAQIGPVSAGAAADRGTRIHKLVEQLWQGFYEDDFLNPTKLEELECAKALVVALTDLVKKHGFTISEVRMEQAVTLHEIHPEAGGIADHVAYRAFGDLLVADTKTGYNYVSVEDSPQLAFYTEGALESMDDFTRASIRNITFAILQSGTEPPYEVSVREWTISKEDYENKYAYPARFKTAIERAESQPDLRIAGEHCEAKYCNARTTCPAYLNYKNESGFNTLNRLMDGEKIDVKAVRGAKLGELAKALAGLDNLQKQVKDDIKTELMKDKTSVPGWELVDSYGSRVWKDAKQIEAIAREHKIKDSEIHVKTLVTPPQFEKLLKTMKQKLDPNTAWDKQLESYTERPYIGLRIAATKETGLIQQFATCEDDLKGTPCGRIKPCPIHDL